MPSVDSYIQAGALGIVAFLVVWFMLRGIPILLQAHEKSMMVLVELYKSETSECRKQAQALNELLGHLNLAIVELAQRLPAKP